LFNPYHSLNKNGVSLSTDAEYLAAADINCFAIANNHVLDWGRVGSFDTLATLVTLKIKTVGAPPRIYRHARSLQRSAACPEGKGTASPANDKALAANGSPRSAFFT